MTSSEDVAEDSRRALKSGLVAFVVGAAASVTGCEVGACNAAGGT